MTSTMKSHPAEAAVTSGGSALWLGLIGAGLGYLAKHQTAGAVIGATIGAAAGASFSHLFEDANFFGSDSQQETADITSNIRKVQVSSAIAAAVAGSAGALLVKKHPTVAGVLAAGAGSAIAAAVADNAFGVPNGQVGTGDWIPVGALS